MLENGNGWSGGPTDLCTGQKRVFQASDGRTDGRTDGQPENIMPPAPKGGGIKNKHDNASVRCTQKQITSNQTEKTRSFIECV